MTANRLDDLQVQVRLPRDHQASTRPGEVIPAGTWVDGWLHRDDWRRTPGGGWEALVRYTVHRDGGSHQHLGTFRADEIRRARRISR